MKSTIAAAIVAVAIPSLGETVNFDDAKTGSLPKNWQGTQTGKGEAKWSIEKDDTAPSKPNVLKQSGEAKFPVCVKTDASLKNGFVEVKFKPLSGKEDQAAGLVWRYRDPDNYYIVRANALEGNVVLYKVEEGKRKELDIVGRKGGYGVDIPIPARQWSTLRVNFSGNRFTVIVNGKQIFEVKDDTFAGAGKVGVWTKADSITLFDDFTYGEK